MKMKENRFILCGLYDKNHNPHEKEQLYNGVVPGNTKKYPLVNKEMFSQVILKRKDYPFRKFTGDEQVYYGWYILVPKDMEILTLNENNSVVLNQDKMKLDVNITHKGVEYDVYGKFNVGKTSDNWSLTIIIA